MKLTDKNVLKWLKAIKCCRLDNMISDMDDNEIEGRSDIQIFADELSYCISKYNDYGDMWYEELAHSKALLKYTKNGKVIPLDSITLKPKKGYRPEDILIAKDVVNEYRRMVSRYNKLKQMGVYGRWYD